MQKCCFGKKRKKQDLSLRRSRPHTCVKGAGIGRHWFCFFLFWCQPESWQGFEMMLGLYKYYIYIRTASNLQLCFEFYLFYIEITSECYIKHLSLILISILLFLMSAVSVFCRWLYGRTVCVIYAFCGVLFGICSLTTLTILSTVCCLKVCYPLHGIQTLYYLVFKCNGVQKSTSENHVFRKCKLFLV